MVKPKLFILLGLPASGKSTKAVELAFQHNATINSSDSIREELSGDVNNQNINQQVFSVLHSRIFTDLYYGKNVVYDATNVTQKHRLAFLKQLEDKAIDCYKICIVMATPFEECIANNSKRERSIPEEVIARMYKNFVMPSQFEGFDEVEICYNRSVYLDYNLSETIMRLSKIPHDNPHHTLSIGEHILESYNQFCTEVVCDSEWSDVFTDDIRISALAMAVRMHDIGKEWTKSFINRKGEITDVAHYYQHHCVGAYDSMFYLKGKLQLEERIRTILLINHHMKPFEWSNNQNPDKAIGKFIKIYGKDFYEDLMLLHKCDLQAH